MFFYHREELIIDRYHAQLKDLLFLLLCLSQKDYFQPNILLKAENFIHIEIAPERASTLIMRQSREQTDVAPSVPPIFIDDLSQQIITALDLPCEDKVFCNMKNKAQVG